MSVTRNGGKARLIALNPDPLCMTRPSRITAPPLSVSDLINLPNP